MPLMKISLQTFMVGNKKYDPCKPHSDENSELAFADKVSGKRHIFLSINDGEQYVLFDEDCNEQTLEIDGCGRVTKPDRCCRQKTPKECKIDELQCKIDKIQSEIDRLKCE